MARVNNLFDLNKKRVAQISEDYKKLFVWYELKKPIGLKKDTAKIKTSSSFLKCKIEIDFNKNILFIKIEQDESDLNKLYRIFIVISYLLGSEITLFYIYKNFPYYNIPHYFNFGNYPFCFVNNRKLILEPKKVIENGYKLLCDRNTSFSRLVPFMLNINTISYSDVRFFAEFSLLEFLARKSSTSVIFNQKEDKKQLKKFSKEILDYIDNKILEDELEILQDGILINKIKKVLSAEDLNQKGNTKDKIISYIENFSSKDMQSYGEYVKDWNELRSKKGLAHGNILKSKSKREEKDELLKEKLHKFLSLIIYKEFLKK